MIRFIVACSVVALFGAGFYIGQFPAEHAGGSSQPIKASFPAIRLISVDSKEVDPSTVPKAQTPEAQLIVEINAASRNQEDSATTTPAKNSDEPSDSAPSVEEKALFVANNKLLKELEHQLLNVGRLRDRVADLEWETLDLQSELLNKDIELANSKAELLEQEASQPTVYNITNVPVGGSVIIKPPAAPVNNQNIDRAEPAAVVPSSGSSFFGPAPDRYEDLKNPGSPEPLNQAQDSSG